ncbi:MAG: YdeI/OmpD-associated family protein [Acidobacteriota bacterium]
MPEWQEKRLLLNPVQNKPLLYFNNRKEWHNWLEKNHNKSDGIWLLYYKKHTGKPRIPYDDAVEEAICFGWIDSTVKRLDEEKYCQKFTPRRKGSIWSYLNKKRVEKLSSLGLIRQPGLDKINEAKKSGMWDRKYPSQVIPEHSPELADALDRHRLAKENFEKLAPSKKKMMIAWIGSAKKDETKERRIREVLDILKSGKELGMK